jgi:hypothetical protein
MAGGVISHLQLFCKGMIKCFEKMLTWPKWKLELEEIFFNKAFQKFHITIWSCMKLGDVLEVLPTFMPKSFLDWFVFIWGCEQCFKMFSEISPRSYYYLKDLKRVYYVCHGKDYGKEDQTLLINDEPNKAFQNLKWTSFFLESFKGKMLSKIRCNGWTCHPICGHPWLDCYWPKRFKFIMTLWSSILSLL